MQSSCWIPLQCIFWSGLQTLCRLLLEFFHSRSGEVWFKEIHPIMGSTSIMAGRNPLNMLCQTLMIALGLSSLQSSFSELLVPIEQSHNLIYPPTACLWVRIRIFTSDILVGSSRVCFLANPLRFLHLLKQIWTLSCRFFHLHEVPGPWLWDCFFMFSLW